MALLNIGVALPDGWLVLWRACDSARLCQRFRRAMPAHNFPSLRKVELTEEAKRLGVPTRKQVVHEDGHNTWRHDDEVSVECDAKLLEYDGTTESSRSEHPDAAQKCPRSVTKVSHVCPKDVPEVSQKCPGSVRVVSQKFPRSVPEVF